MKPQLMYVKSLALYPAARKLSIRVSYAYLFYSKRREKFVPFKSLVSGKSKAVRAELRGGRA